MTALISKLGLVPSHVLNNVQHYAGDFYTAAPCTFLGTPSNEVVTFFAEKKHVTLTIKYLLTHSVAAINDYLNMKLK